MTVDVLSDLDAIQGLKGDWDRLARGGSPAQGFIWFEASVRTFGATDSFLVVVIRDGNHVSALAPLVRPLKDPRLYGLGAWRIAMPCGFLFENQEALERLANGVASLRRPLVLRRVPAASPIEAALRRAFKPVDIITTASTEWSPYVELDKSWQEPKNKLKKKRRAELRRAFRVAEQMGTVRTEIVCPGVDDVGPLVEEVFRVEAAGWKGRARTDLMFDQLRGDWHRDYARRAAEIGILRLCVLRIDDRAVAMEYDVEWDHRLWSLKSGYDEEFRRCSPSTLLMYEVIRYAGVQGLEAYEMLGGMEPYKAVWTSSVHPCISARVYPLNAAGLVSLAADGFGFASRLLPGRGP